MQLVLPARRPLAAVKDGEPTASPRRPRMAPPRKSDEAKEELRLIAGEKEPRSGNPTGAPTCDARHLSTFMGHG